VEGKHAFVSLFLSAFFILLSYFSKESAIIFSGAAVLYAFVFDRRKVIYVGLAHAIPILIYGFIRFFLIKGVFFSEYDRAIVPIQTMSFFERILHAPSVLLFYFKTFIFPLSLHIEQYWVYQKFGFGNFFLPLIIVSCIFGGLFYLGTVTKNKNRTSFPIFLFFFGCLFLWAIAHIHIFPLTMTVAERWFYSAGFFMTGIFGVLLSSIKDPKKRKIAFILLLTITIVLSARTIVRNTNWKDDANLYTHDYRIDPDNYALENNYGSILFNSGKKDEACIHIAKSTELSPLWWRNWTNLGICQEQKGEIDKAIASYKISIKNNPGYALTYIKLTSIYLFSMNLTEAEKLVKEGLSYSPKNPELLRLYAFILYGSKKKDQAIVEMKKAYLIDPSSQNKELFDSMNNGERLQIKK
jgi:hypothetical protein